MKNKIFTFPVGGIHPNKFKLSSDRAMKYADLPDIVYISLCQHRGKPAIPVVQKGDKVKAGTLIAKADGDFSANIHSSVSGEVIKIENMLNEYGYPQPMIAVKVIGDEWDENIDRSDTVITEITKDKSEILSAIQNAGIIGLSGSGFPTSLKLNVPENKHIDTIIINGIECEPYFTTDDRVMQEKAEQVVIGARILNKIFGIQHAVIAIDENKPKAIKILQKITSGYVGVNVVVCKTKYPQGSEKQLIKAVTNREVPPGCLPADVGCLVQNVGTVFAIYEAVQKNKPLIECIVVVSGDMVEKPCNIIVRIGTPFSFILQQEKIDYTSAEKIIIGGPLMGKSGVYLDAPVSKTSSGILLMGKNSLVQETNEECIRCGRCVSVCPMGLQPYLITSAVKDDNLAKIKNLNILSCLECGCCTYECPAKIRVTDYCRLGKAKLLAQKR